MWMPFGASIFPFENSNKFTTFTVLFSVIKVVELSMFMSQTLRQYKTHPLQAPESTTLDNEFKKIKKNTGVFLSRQLTAIRSFYNTSLSVPLGGDTCDQP